MWLDSEARAHPARMRLPRAASALQPLLTGQLPEPCPGCLSAHGRCGCHAALSVWRAAPDSRVLSDAFPVVAVSHYSGPARRLLVAWKERGDPRPAAVFAPALAAALAALLGHVPEWPGHEPVVLVPVPARRRATLQRGGHIVRALAKGAATQLQGQGVPCTVAAAGLRRGSGMDQVGLDASQRRSNAMNSYRIAGRPRPVGPVLLVDDVATTGATLAACRTLLAESGHLVIGAAVVCATKVFPWP